jgi:hypothetical protein
MASSRSAVSPPAAHDRTVAAGISHAMMVTGTL